MKKWMILHNGHRKACEALFAALQPYFSDCLICDSRVDSCRNMIALEIDSQLGGNRIYVSSPKGSEQSIVIQGSCEAQLYYGVMDFIHCYLPRNWDFRDTGHGQILPETFLPYEKVSAPRILHRGLWTWGHVVYDYRRYIDHMAALKLNTLILWNDYLPTNIHDVLRYAHDNYICVYLGYSWGWDTTMPETITQEYLQQVEAQALETYQQVYRDIPCDGIYIQTFTEHANDTIDGACVADTVVALVNRVGGAILARQPELTILFGLHATSVMNRLDSIARLDPRISIIWEDVGAFPWDYLPQDGDFSDTLARTQALQNLRPAGGFGGVLKGYLTLDWTQFQHPEGPAPLGVSAPDFVRDMARKRKSAMRHYQAAWLKYAPEALALIRELRPDAMMTCLVEDACFEEMINFPTALLASMLWDSHRDIGDIVYETALRPDVTFV